MRIGRHVRIERRLRLLDQRVPQADPVVARIRDLLTGLRVDCGHGRGERQQSGPQGRPVLDGATPLHPDPTGAIVGDGQEASKVRDAILAGQLLLPLSLGAVGVDLLDHAPATSLQLGRRQSGRLIEEDPLSLFAGLLVAWQPVDSIEYDVCLLRADPTLHQSSERRRSLVHQLVRVVDGLLALAVPDAGKVSEPVGGGAPPETSRAPRPGCRARRSPAPPARGARCARPGSLRPPRPARRH